MIPIKPFTHDHYSCDCGSEYCYSGLLWQGLHVCAKYICNSCKRTRIDSLQNNQSGIEPYIFYPESGLVQNPHGEIIPDNWYSRKLKAIAKPIPDPIEMEVEIREKCDRVIILNTLDYIYGHSLLFLLNLQRLIEHRNGLGIILIVQPMLKWLVPVKGIAEIWTVKLGFQDFNRFYQDLSDKINSQFYRFKEVILSKGHVVPTDRNILIENYTGVRPYNFSESPAYPKITFIWREDPGRLWVRNIFLHKGLKKLGIGKVFLPFHYMRVLLFFHLLKKRIGGKYIYTIAGLGTFGKWAKFIEDHRVNSFDDESEKRMCTIYAQSILAIGIHGSSMLLPSAHAGMSISMMPSRRWGNYAEDILFNEDDIRLAFFQKRIVPLNMSIFDLRDIACEMIIGRDAFIKKFIHSDEL
jgi:hypothetical protein